MTQRAAIFLNVGNLDQSFRKFGSQVDYPGLRDYLAEGRVLVEAFAYLPINPFNPERKKNFAEFLRHHGFVVRSKTGKPRPDNKWKCNVNTEMAVDILHFVHAGRVDIIVIGSGDGDMLRVCEKVRSSGIRCEIAATKESTAEELLGAANGFVDLGIAIREQLGQIIWNKSEDTDRVVPDIEEFLDS